MDKDYDGRITIDEFINVFLEAEDILNGKIKDLRNNIEDQHRQRNEVFVKLEEIKNYENLNNFGICQNSQLNIIAIQLNDIHSQEYDSFYVIFECGEQNSKSNLSSFSNPKIDFSTALFIFEILYLNFNLKIF